MKRKGLSEEDKALWKKVSKTAEPLHPDKPKITSPEARPLPMPKPVTVESPRIRPFELGAKAKSGTKGHDLMPSISDRVGSQPVQMDKKAYGRLQKGKLTPERKIDLHGMTLDEAHPALVDFILRSHAKGLRLVLVITGKGKGRETIGGVGILRRQVPMWLHQAPLGPLILEISEAHSKHGGGGALYVYLRRRR